MNTNTPKTKTIEKISFDLVKDETFNEIYLSSKFDCIREQLVNILECAENWNDKSASQSFSEIKKGLKELTSFVETSSKEYEKIKIKQEIKDFTKSVEKDKREIAALTKNVEEKTKLISHLKTKLEFLEEDLCSEDSIKHDSVDGHSEYTEYISDKDNDDSYSKSHKNIDEKTISDDDNGSNNNKGTDISDDESNNEDNDDKNNDKNCNERNDGKCEDDYSCNSNSSNEENTKNCSSEEYYSASSDDVENSNGGSSIDKSDGFED